MKILKVVMFADVSAYAHMHDLSDLKKAVNNDLKIISDRFKTNKLSLNISKIKSMLFTKSNNPPDIALFIDDQIIEHTKSTKFLGVIVDKDLSWKEPIKACKTKLASSLYAINASKIDWTEKM